MHAMCRGGFHRLLAVAAACALGCCSGADGGVSSGSVEAAAGDLPRAAEANSSLAAERGVHLGAPVPLGVAVPRRLDDRSYLLGVPTDYETVLGNRSLLLLLHGFDDKPEQIFERFNMLLDIVDAPLLVAPLGFSEFGMPRSWNTVSSGRTSGPDGDLCAMKFGRLGCARQTCGRERSCHFCLWWHQCAARCVWATCKDDHAFIADLLDTMEGEFRIDRQRIFLAGFSMGGIMAWDILSHKHLSRRFTAVAALHGSPQAGFAPVAPDPENFPWLLGIWGGLDKGFQDGKMPPFSNIKGRPDKSATTRISGGAWWYNTAENATKTYAKELRCPSSGLTLDTIMQPLWLKDRFNCTDDGCNGTVVRCTWPTYHHGVSTDMHALVWRYFVLAANARFGPAACPYPRCAGPWQSESHSEK